MVFKEQCYVLDPCGREGVLHVVRGRQPHAVLTTAGVGERVEKSIRGILTDYAGLPLCCLASGERWRREEESIEVQDQRERAYMWRVSTAVSLASRRRDGTCEPNMGPASTVSQRCLTSWSDRRPRRAQGNDGRVTAASMTKGRANQDEHSYPSRVYEASEAR